MTSPYSVNWNKYPHGNGIKSGKDIVIQVNGVDSISAGIYKDNLPIQVGFEMGESLTMILSRRKRGLFGWKTVGLKKGKYVLKVRAYINGKGQGWDDEFIIT